MTRANIDDAEWFELQFDPARAKSKYGIELPDLPDDATQISFTGMCGRPNLRQAFSFYLYAQEVSGISKLRDPRIMDFGAGWGRIARLFAREVHPQDIVAADTMSFAIECLRSTRSAFRLIHNPPAPPIQDFQQTFHLIYAYSVFSHLSEPYSRAWLDYLLRLLRPGGYLILTTRGERFISYLSELKAQTDDYILKTVGSGEHLQYLQRLRKSLPDPALIRDRLRSGEFQFFHVGHNTHIEDCAGETFMPRAYFETHYREYLVSFREDVENIDQSVVVLKKSYEDNLPQLARTDVDELRSRLGEARIQLWDSRSRLGEANLQLVELRSQSEGIKAKLVQAKTAQKRLKKILLETRQELSAIRCSRSWRFTGPIRRAVINLRRLQRDTFGPGAK